jgi:magnesium chelatase family protein
VVAARVRQALARQHDRQGTPNALLEGEALRRHATPDAAGLDLLHAAAQRLGWSGRAVHRVQRVARTLADLAGQAVVGRDQVAEAVQYRRVLVGG